MKALFCGLGSIGQRHLRNLRALLGDRVEILAYRQRGLPLVLNPDMTVRAGAQLETTYGVRSFDNLDAALGEGPDVVFVTNPNTLHVPVALAAARAGCHLFIEKPLSHSLDGVAELVDVVESKHLVALVGYQFRFHPGLRLIKQVVAEGRLGRLAAAHIVNGEYLPDWHSYEDYRATHPARRELGGGALRIQSHELDYALWLCGMPTRVYAVGGHLSRLELDVEDSVSVLLTCEPDGHPRSRARASRLPAAPAAAGLRDRGGRWEGSVRLLHPPSGAAQHGHRADGRGMLRGVRPRRHVSRRASTLSGLHPG